MEYEEYKEPENVSLLDGFNRNKDAAEDNDIPDISEVNDSCNYFLESDNPDSIEIYFTELEKCTTKQLNLHAKTEQCRNAFTKLTGYCSDEDSFINVSIFIDIFRWCDGFIDLFKYQAPYFEDFIIENGCKSAMDLYINILYDFNLMPLKEDFYNALFKMNIYDEIAYIRFYLFLYKNNYTITEDLLLKIINNVENCGLVINDFIQTATSKGDVQLSLIQEKAFLNIFYQCWREQSDKLWMKGWKKYCKQKRYNKPETKLIAKFIHNEFIGKPTPKDWTARSFILKFLQGVSFIDIKLLMSLPELIKIIEMFKMNPKRGMIFLITSFNIRKGDYGYDKYDQSELICNFKEEVHTKYDNNEYNDDYYGYEGSTFQYSD